MKIIFSIFVFSLILVSSATVNFSQINKDSWKVVYLNIPEDSGCMSYDEQEKLRKQLIRKLKPKPKDVAGLILKGFRKLLRMDSNWIMDFNCLSRINDLSFKNIAPRKTTGEKTIRIEVTVKAVDIEIDPLTYRCKTDQGKIIGVGSKVIWELPATPSRVYSIEICANDGGGCKKNINIASAHIYVTH